MTIEHAIKYLTLKLEVNKSIGFSGEQNEVAEISIKVLQENEQLKELLRLAVADMKHCVDDTGCEICGNKTCKGFDDCEYNFVWQHAGKLKGLGIEV